MPQELSYSFHLGSNKNRKNSAKEIAKDNTSGTTSLANNGIQNANQLSRVNKHNLRDYDNNRDYIEVIKGSYNLVEDVKAIYMQEFEEARTAYNKKVRVDKQIQDYFKHISKSPMWDLCCEIIIELGDMYFWNDKDLEYRKEMAKVYAEQIEELNKILPEFKVASAVVHFEERSKSPHMHIVGVPVKEDCKRGMKKQVGKSQIFTKSSLTKIQDKMRVACIKSYNKIYDSNAQLKEKQKGRNYDINTKNMDSYKKFADNYDKHNQKLKLANDKTNKVYTSSNEIKEILDKLKPTTFNKNNSVISNSDIEKVKEYIEEVQDTTKTISTVNELNIVINEFKNSYNEIGKENSSLKYQLKLKDEEIDKLKGELSTKDKIINRLQAEKENIKLQLQKFKNFWYGIMNRFHNKISFDKDEQYKYVSEDLHKTGIFSDDDFEIATNALRKVKPKEEVAEKDKKKEKSDKWTIKK